MNANTRRRRRTAGLDRSQLVFLMRTQPERFSTWQVELMHEGRINAVETLGDVVDWDCYDCRRAVVTAHLNDPCPHCHKAGELPEGYRTHGDAGRNFVADLEAWLKSLGVEPGPHWTNQ